MSNAGADLQNKLVISVQVVLSLLRVFVIRALLIHKHKREGGAEKFRNLLFRIAEHFC